MDTLERTSGGTALVTTETGSKYLLDLDRGTVKRKPRSRILGLFGDREELPLLELGNCTVGEALEMVLGTPDGPSPRRASKVTSIATIG
ncbi:hypothetical protein ACFVAJ_18700 [Agromyces sp. NPDC057679]|uniref:hypothetical protein n=1 Tax=Agromyces sp. NPDC057679 TaxID=3346207 RepID=UPI00366AE3CC